MGVWAKILAFVLSIFILGGCSGSDIDTNYETDDGLSFSIDYGDARTVLLYNTNSQLVEVDFGEEKLIYDLDYYGEVIGTAFEVDGEQLYNNPVVFTYNSAGKVVEASMYEGEYETDLVMRDVFTYNEYGEVIIVECQYTDFNYAYYFNYDEYGQLVSREYDEYNDGYVDEVSYYIYNYFGQVSEILYDSNNIGIIDRVKYFLYDEYGRLVQVQDDENNDGVMDVYHLGNDSYQTYVYENYNEVTLTINTSEYESTVVMRYDGDIADKAYEFLLAEELFYLDMEYYKFFLFAEEF